MVIEPSLALDHLRHHQRDQPVIGDDVVVENLAKLVVGNSGLRPVIGIRRGVADQRVDLAEHAVGFLDQMLQIVLGRDIGGHRERDLLAGLVVDRLGHLVADRLLARGDHHLGAVLGHPLGDGAADAARGAGDDGDFSRHIEQGHVLSPTIDPAADAPVFVSVQLSSVHIIRQQNAGLTSGELAGGRDLRSRRLMHGVMRGIRDPRLLVDHRHPPAAMTGLAR